MKENTLLKSFVFFTATLFIGWHLMFLGDIQFEEFLQKDFEIKIIGQYLQMIFFMVMLGGIFCAPLLILIVPYFWLTGSKASHLNIWQHMALNALFALALSWGWAELLQSWDDVFDELQGFIPGAMLAGVLIEMVFPAEFKNKRSGYFTRYFNNHSLKYKKL